jgi:hypothetical protein
LLDLTIQNHVSVFVLHLHYFTKLHKNSYKCIYFYAYIYIILYNIKYISAILHTLTHFVFYILQLHHRNWILDIYIYK